MTPIQAIASTPQNHVCGLQNLRGEEILLILKTVPVAGHRAVVGYGAANHRVG
jgi:chemotaxis signal transduction protein